MLLFYEKISDHELVSLLFDRKHSSELIKYELWCVLVCARFLIKMKHHGAVWTWESQTECVTLAARAVSIEELQL